MLDQELEFSHFQWQWELDQVGVSWQRMVQPNVNQAVQLGMIQSEVHQKQSLMQWQH